MSQRPFIDNEGTSPAPLERRLSPRDARVRVGLNLFWRTFYLLGLLLAGSILAWLQTLRALEFEPRTIYTAQQIASLVNLSRAALTYADPITRVVRRLGEPVQFDPELLTQLQNAGVVPGATVSAAAAGSYTSVSVEGFGDGLELPNEVAVHIFVGL